jgi:O-antigen/teichoic acid export membrane protein
MSVSKSIAWMGTAQVVGMACQFASQVVLVRQLTLHEAGIYAVAFAVVSALSLVQTLGLQALIVREDRLTPDLVSTAFTINAIISIALAFAIAALGFGGRVFLGDPGVQHVLVVLAITPLFAIFSFLPASMLEREARFREIALAGVAGIMVGAIVTVVLALLGFKYMSAAYAQCANLSVTAAITIGLGRQHFNMRTGFGAWRRVGDFGLQMLAVNGVSALGLRLSDILLGRILGLSSLGLYSRASGLNGLIWANVHLLIGRVMLVDFADLRRQGISLRARYIQTVDLATVLLWPVFAGFAAIAGPFILFIYGAKWVPAASPLIFLAIASITLVSITMTWELFTLSGQLRTQTRIEFIRSIVGLIAFVVGCSISLEAAAAARIFDAAFAFVLYRPHLNRMTDTSLKDFLPIYVRNFLLCIVAIGPTATLRSFYHWSADVPLIPLFGSISLGVIFWCCGMIFSRHPLVAEVKRWKIAKGRARAEPFSAA